MAFRVDVDSWDLDIDVDTVANRAVVARRAFVTIPMDRPKPIVSIVFSSPDGSFFVVERRRGGIYYVSHGDGPSKQVSQEEVKSLLIGYFAGFMRRRYQFEISDVRLSNLKYGIVEFVERPKTIALFGDDGRFALPDGYIERRADGFVVYDSDNPHGLPVSNKEAVDLIASVLESELTDMCRPINAVVDKRGRSDVDDSGA